MKSAVFALTLILNPLAFAETNTVLAGDCKPAVAQALSDIGGEAVVTVKSVDEISGNKIIVSYLLESEEGTQVGKAVVELENVVEVPRARKNYLIKCDVLSATIIDAI